MKNYAKYIVAFAVVFAALGYFIVSSVSGEKIYYKEVSELVGDTTLEGKRGLRVSGKVTDTNFSMNKFERTATFDVTDAGGGVMTVTYNGEIPDAFEEGAEVVLEGTYDVSQNLFTAKKLMAKCPSKYEAEGEVHPDNVTKTPDDVAQN
ncbi:MAG: cytochrome c maturation protein CcmE [Deferribacteraceae bacterium]|jgi:cytochrome c-type biogenesis protein CcmE|nr:cytochrome c maturation protein CcmE [Deferribacteraceae bacterium]